MKRAALFLATGALLAIPAAIVAQEMAGKPTGTEFAVIANSSEEPFPWFTFIEPDPLPGGYEFRVFLEDFTIFDQEGSAEAQFFEEILTGGGSEMELTYFCVAGEIERFDLLAEIAEETGECQVSPVTTNDGAFEVRAACREPDGSRMRARLSGEADETSINAVMEMNSKDREIGHFGMDMRIELERVGECSDLPEGQAILVESIPSE